MKKTIIICISLVLVASMALVGIILLKNNGNKGDDSGKGKAVMTYEEFTKSVRTDLSNEVKEEIQKIYDEYKNAKDEETRSAVLKRYYGMDIFLANDKTPIDKGNYDKGVYDKGGKK